MLYLKFDFDINLDAVAYTEINRIIIARKGDSKLGKSMLDLLHIIENTTEKKEISLDEFKNIIIKSNLKITNKKF